MDEESIITVEWTCKEGKPGQNENFVIRGKMGVEKRFLEKKKLGKRRVKT